LSEERWITEKFTVAFEVDGTAYKQCTFFSLAFDAQWMKYLAGHSRRALLTRLVSKGMDNKVDVSEPGQRIALPWG
jgi:hypothetical protein